MIEGPSPASGGLFLKICHPEVSAVNAVSRN
jgi:hypothetical protein